MERKRDSFFLASKKEKKDKQFNKKQVKFDENRPGLNKEADKETKENGSKKPFDKKTYRLKKYSKKYKLEQWEEQRKKKMLRNYYKETKNDEIPGSYKPISFDENADTTDSSQIGRFVRHPDIIERENSEQQIKKKKDPYIKAKEQYNKIKQEKLDKKKEIEKVKEEKMQKLQEYKKKKQERFKKLSKKTKKGQPMMTGRLELLLEKIQKG